MNPPTLAVLRAQAEGAGARDPHFLLQLADDPRAGAQALLARCLRRAGARSAEDLRLRRMLLHEQAAMGMGFARVAGVDEAGRGPLAGPLVAAAVVLAGPLPGVDDSKRLTEEVRERLYAELHAGGHTLGVGIVVPDQLDRMGVQAANYHAMGLALAALAPAADYALVDGFQVPGLAVPHRRLIKGDRRSQSVAAASIVAKVTRDRMMAEAHEAYPQYNFARHKGYGTAEHLAALAQHGPCPLHRRSFAPVGDTVPRTGALFEPAAEA